VLESFAFFNQDQFPLILDKAFLTPEFIYYKRRHRSFIFD
jgi:hypothetical protein